VPIEELMDTLIQEVELMAKEKDAEGNGDAVAPSNEGWESMLPQSDQPSTLGKEIPVLSSKR
jgi:(E)-4-hydroxy-3-methylbut-2-enyl-diphosphate synthase